MPIGDFQELRGTDAETGARGNLDALISIYTSVQARLARILATGQPTDFQKWRYGQILRHVRAEVRNLNALAAEWAGKHIPQVYNRAATVASSTIKGYGSIGRLSFTNVPHKRAIKILVDQTTLDLLKANGAIKTKIEQYVRATQQKLLQEKVINDTIAEGLVEGVTWRTTRDEIYTKLRDAMGQQQFITINGRNYTPEYYSTMVARTRIREATGQATVMTNLEYGNDLVQVDIHAGACPICKTHMGRVYSISGKNTDFPPLEERAPYHPHCRCSIIPVIPEIMISRGTYIPLSKLSKASPTFRSERQAQEWLATHPTLDFDTIQDLTAWVSYNK